MGGYGFMVRGLKYLVRIIVVLFILSGCTTPVLQNNIESNQQTIGEVQSKVVTLTLECDDGIQESCQKLPIYIDKLKIMLNRK